MRETTVKNAWDQSAVDDDHLLFGSRSTSINLSTLHPDPVQIFRLWQIYLDNVNPLLKVTHTPSLQGRIIEAASSSTNISPTLEALMFSIYCTSIQSLVQQDCQTLFGSSKEDLLMRYRFGCQQALFNCSFLRSSDRDCLTALHLYLVSLFSGWSLPSCLLFKVSVRHSTVSQSLSSMMGVAIRIAQRMGIHSESALAKCTVLEAEMRRRLWWSLILFDYRISQMSISNSTTLDPTWDCKIPLNVNDSDLRPEMKAPPAIQGKSTEALFAVVRSEMGEFMRHNEFHLEFACPALKPIAKRFQNGLAPDCGEMIKLEEMVEDQYLKFCDQENPIQFLTIWTTRSYVAKCLLLEHQSKSGSSIRQTEAQRDAATSYALRALECDTKVMTSTLTQGFRWLNILYFPFPAYFQLVQDLRRRPFSEQAEKAWEIMSDNYQTWFDSKGQPWLDPKSGDESPFFQMIAKLVFQAWDACETASKQLGLTPPRIVSSIRHTLVEVVQHARKIDTEQSDSVKGMEIGDFTTPMSTGFTNQSLQHSTAILDDYTLAGQEMSSDGIPGQASLDSHLDQLDWTAFGEWPVWGGC